MSNNHALRIRVIEREVGNYVLYAIAEIGSLEEDRLIAAVYSGGINGDKFLGHHSFLKSDWYAMPTGIDIGFVPAEVAFGEAIKYHRSNLKKTRKPKRDGAR